VTSYRLGPVRDARARDENASRGELADTIADATRAQAAVAVADRRIEAARARVDDAAAAAEGVAGRLALADRYRERLRHELELACVERERLAGAHRDRQAEVDRARGRFAWARARKQVVERHFERWRDEQRKLAERRQD